MPRAFRFRLARVQRVRDLEERVARAAWGEAQAEALQAERSRDRASTHLEETRRELTRRPAERLDPGQALLGERLLDAGLEALHRTHETVETTRTQAETARSAWAERERDRRALDKLEERHRSAHLEEVRKAENAQMDEVAGQRHGRGGPGSAPSSAQRGQERRGGPLDPGAGPEFARSLETDSSGTARLADHDSAAFPWPAPPPPR